MPRIAKPKPKLKKEDVSETKKPIVKKEKKIALKKDGYILIITEKPQAAMKIAASLGSPRSLSDKGAPYYELERNGRKIVVACAVGHLFTLKQDAGEKGWPVYNISWVPGFEKNIWAKKYYALIAKLCRGASEFIVATDYDIEGEVIGLNIIRFIAGQKDARRMKFSTLTKNEIEEAYDNSSPTLNWGQAIAGETRHYLDWIYGINFSRALMESVKKAGSFKIMSIGRVQGPALNSIVKKEKEIQAFKSEPYWQVFISVKNIELKYVKDLVKKSDLGQFENLTGKKAELNTEKSEQKIKPLAPFDLTTLQTEAYKFFNITPSRTLQIAQGLYLAGLISYPRTSSQKIPDSINPLGIIKKLSGEYPVKLCVNKKPVEGNKSDPAHPSIYPTGEIADLSGEEQKIYDLIARRFLSCFCEDAIVANKIITAMVGESRFTARGLGIVKKAWMEMYKLKMQEKELPDLNGAHNIDDSRIEEKQTMPPKRFTPASLVRELEKKNLGTKATRASIVETLYDRGYVKDQSIKATPIGIALIDTLGKHCPIIIDEHLTRKIEKEMDGIVSSSKGLKEKEDKILDDAKKSINIISKKFKEDEEEIGLELVKANKDMYAQERADNELTVCTKCGKGKLRILYGKKFKRYFAACSNYPECKTTFSLPPNSLIKPCKDSEGVLELCPDCKSAFLLAIRKGKRPWKFCFNPLCPSRKKQEEAKEQE